MSDNHQKIKEEYLKDLYDDYRYSINKFDTYTVYLSGGALAISLTFVENIVPIKEAICIYLYYGAIILFGFTMIFGLFAHYKSAVEIDKRLKLIEQDNFDRLQKDMDKDKISIMNLILICTITIGTIFLIAFSIINMNALNNKSKHRQHNSISYDQPENTVSIKEIE